MFCFEHKTTWHSPKMEKTFTKLAAYMDIVEGVFEHLRLAVLDCPVMANGVSLNGENASKTSEKCCRDQMRMKQYVFVRKKK